MSLSSIILCYCIISWGIKIAAGVCNFFYFLVSCIRLQIKEFVFFTSLSFFLIINIFIFFIILLFLFYFSHSFFSFPYFCIMFPFESILISIFFFPLLFHRSFFPIFKILSSGFVFCLH